MMTLRSVLLVGEKELAAKGGSSPRLDAEVLLAHALSLPRIALYLDPDRPLGGHEVDRFRGFLDRRLAFEPVAYITGTREFYGVPLAVDSRVLIPRPETEHVVENVLDWLSARSPPFRIADVGTGSGAIAIALAKTLGSKAVIVASDVSKAALEVAHANVCSQGVSVELVCGHLTVPVAPLGPFDVIVANLPYLTSAEMGTLMPEVTFEPELALAADHDGLSLIRALIEVAPLHLAKPSGLFLEIGSGQRLAVEALLRQRGFCDVSTTLDLAGFPRVARGITCADEAG